jgi:valyl-tRNA synthetase
VPTLLEVCIFSPDSSAVLNCKSGRDINLEILRVEGYRKFCNKIFNATKFAMLKLDESFVPEPSAKVRRFWEGTVHALMS